MVMKDNYPLQGTRQIDIKQENHRNCLSKNIQKKNLNEFFRKKINSF